MNRTLVSRHSEILVSLSQAPLQGNKATRKRDPLRATAVALLWDRVLVCIRLTHSDPSLFTCFLQIVRFFRDPVTETPKQGGTELWNIINLTGDTHPIHVHLVKLRLVSRYSFDNAKYQAGGCKFDTKDPASSCVQVLRPELHQLMARYNYSLIDKQITNKKRSKNAWGELDFQSQASWYVEEFSKSLTFDLPGR